MIALCLLDRVCTHQQSYMARIAVLFPSFLMTTGMQNVYVWFEFHKNLMFDNIYLALNGSNKLP